MLRTLIFFFVTILVAFGAFSQQYNFRNFTAENGFPEATVSALYEDSRGNLWIGTLGGGLLRYDGYSFQSYLKEEGLINNFVHSIFEDKSGKIWIGTEEGICTYDGFRFASFGGLSKQTINAILQDGAGHLWFASSDGLYQYSGSLLTQFSTKQGLTDNRIHCLYLDKRNDIWIGTAKGVAKYSRQHFTFYTENDGLASNIVNGIAEDRLGYLWFATDAGVSNFDGENFTNYSTKNGLRSNKINAIEYDSKGNLWFGTSAGISKYNGKTFDHYDAHTGQSINIITSIYEDRTGNLWFGSAEKGLSKLDSERFIHYPENDQLGKRVYAVVQALNGNIICGTSLGGTTVFDGKQYTLLDGMEGFTSSIVQSFFYAPDSTLWVGTEDEGVYKFKKSGVIKYSSDEGSASNNITGFAADRLGNIWTATGDSGIFVIPRHSGDSLYALKKYNTGNGLASNKINAITSDAAGNIWIGTEDKGVNRIIIPVDSTTKFSIESITANDGLNSNSINTLITDSLNNIYIGTSKGIAIYSENSFIKITKATGLASNNIYSLTLDNKGDLWAGTERGVERISFGDKFSAPVVRHFGAEDGFKGVEVYRNSSCKDRDGNIWFGTVNGLIKYNPAEEISSSPIPKVHITGIRLFFDKIEDTPYADSVSAWYSIPAKLTLPYNQNSLTFSFAGIHHRSPQSVKYKWMLEGSNEGWSPPLTEREARFTNLLPGDYTFKVIASNEENIWSKVPAEFSFRIEPPFWQRWWVRTLGAAAIIGMIWLIFYIRLQRVKAKNRIIQERLEMEKNILELEQEAARLQMNPHFIFNSLNSIQGFITTNDPVQAKKYLAKFARLMRLILENAREEFIPLQNEIHILENYLELEKLSSNHKFDFVITTDANIDPDRIQIPPMMLQPFVENAIIHGVKKKEGKGVITIHFKRDAELIICEIADNGIGRKRSGQINGQSRAGHKSTGISVTTQRLEQYGLHRKVKAGIEFIDLEVEGSPAGTKVVIATPFEYS